MSRYISGRTYGLSFLSAIKDGSKFFIKTSKYQSSLEHQGTGIKRAFLWSAVNTLCSEGLYKKGTKKIQDENSKILLIDEPEINLHPSIIKAARKAIYALADMQGLQIICTTYSPIFIVVVRTSFLVPRQSLYTCRR
ncbi:AAA family ATPase [Aliiglaciecola lipolytica]|uniref:AAA family ATPase n=1 Tax=Aliiglaciecola lipolytica TaxID=477689 RepID=UPI002ADDB2A3|nr:AAA family ATPase [Aliiglaciecola lipolytica]